MQQIGSFFDKMFFLKIELIANGLRFVSPVLQRLTVPDGESPRQRSATNKTLIYGD
jgi:hypothetical protein